MEGASSSLNKSHGAEAALTRSFGDKDSVRQDVSKEVDPVSVHDSSNILVRVTSIRQEPGHLLQIDNGIEIARALLRTVATIQIAPDRGVPRVPCELTDIVDLVSHSLQADDFR